MRGLCSLAKVVTTRLLREFSVMGLKAITALVASEAPFCRVIWKADGCALVVVLAAVLEGKNTCTLKQCKALIH